MAHKDANEDIAAQLQLGGEGLSPLVEIRYRKPLHKGEGGWGAGDTQGRRLAAQLPAGPYDAARCGASACKAAGLRSGVWAQ